MLGCAGKSQAGGVAAAGGAPSAVPSALLTQGGWDVTAALTAKVPGTTLPLETLSFTLDVQGDLQGLSAIMGAAGRAVALPLQRTSGSSANATSTDGVSLMLVGAPNSVLGLNFHSLTLTASDQNGDGIADRIDGTADAQLDITCGDCTYNDDVALTLTGQPDSAPPRLNVPTVPVNPLDALTFAVSEPLESVKLALAGTSNIAIDTPSIAADGSRTWLVDFPIPQVLPFSGRWQVTGSGQDFASHPLNLSGAVLTTLDDPGVLAQDGFEGTLNATLAGDAEVVGVASGLPIPNGKQALLVPPNSSATLHLVRLPSQHQLTATVVALTNDTYNGSPYGAFEAGVVGGTERATLQWPYSAMDRPTSSAAWAQAGTAVTASASLGGGGTDVVIRLAPSSCMGPCAPGAALLIDDVQIQ